MKTRTRTQSREERASDARMELRRLDYLVRRGDANATHLARYEQLLGRHASPILVDRPQSAVDDDWADFDRNARTRLERR